MIFFLPLGGNSEWQDNETRYLLRSLEKNFKESFDVIIYAQKKPEWLNIKYKELERYYPKSLLKINRGARIFENYFDVLNKVYVFVHSEDCPEDFIYIYDDIILIKEITSQDIINIPQCEYTPKMFSIYEQSRQGKTTNQAYILSDAKYNFEHHLPLIYRRDNLIELFKRFPFQEMIVPYSLATLYFNVYKEEYISPPLSEFNNYKVGFEGFTDRITCFKQDTIEDIEKTVKGKTWINFNDFGLFWMPPKYPLQQWIKETFTNKSKYEKI